MIIWTYAKILNELLKFGKKDLHKMDKETFINICSEDYCVSRTTAEKVYNSYCTIKKG